MAQEYHLLNRHDQAMKMIWENFSEGRGLSAYQELKKHAELAGQWASWRERALEFLEQRFAAAKREHGPQDRWFRPDKSDLVEILLWEKDAEGAWKEARDGGCRPELWMNLASLREKEHPEDALAVYRGEIKRELDSSGHSPDYRDVVRLVRHVQELMARNGRYQEFAAYLAELRTVYKRKRNLMKLLDRIKPAGGKKVE